METLLDLSQKEESEEIEEVIKFVKSLSAPEHYEFMGIVRGVQMAHRAEKSKKEKEHETGGMAMYLNKRKIVAEYGICMSTLDKAIREIRNQIPKRYPQGAVIEHPIRVRDDVFRDFQLYQDEIAAGCAPKFVPSETHVWNKEVV